MARIITCDICGKECEEYLMYTLIKHKIFSPKRSDICYDCIDRIEEEVKAEKVKKGV